MVPVFNASFFSPASLRNLLDPYEVFNYMTLPDAVRETVRLGELLLEFRSSNRRQKCDHLSKD